MCKSGWRVACVMSIGSSRYSGRNGTISIVSATYRLRAVSIRTGLWTGEYIRNIDHQGRVLQSTGDRYEHR